MPFALSFSWLHILYLYSVMPPLLSDFIATKRSTRSNSTAEHELFASSKRAQQYTVLRLCLVDCRPAWHLHRAAQGLAFEQVVEQEEPELVRTRVAPVAAFPWPVRSPQGG